MCYDLRHNTSSLKHGGGNHTRMDMYGLGGTGSLVFVDDVSADVNRRIN